MKVITNNKIYVQKKDLELIFKIKNKDEVPNSIIEKYKENININDLDFILFESKKEIDFLNSFWFIINYSDIIDFNDLEILDYYGRDLHNLEKMRIEFDEHKFIAKKNISNSLFDLTLNLINYCSYLPNKNEAKNYPLDFQLLYNKVFDIIELNHFKHGLSKLNLPNEIFKPVQYTKKQLQQIYYEVLGENLTFEELKPYEKQLYSIFTRINYTPDILDIIRKIMIINRYNTLDFINDDLLDIILRINGKKSKFEESTIDLIDYLYAIGYNRFDNFDSKIILEKDLKIIKKIIYCIARANLEEEYIDKLATYNYILAEMTRALNKCNFNLKETKFVRDLFSNMLVYVYFNPSVINYDYDFLRYVYDYLINNYLEILKYIEYDIEIKYVYGDFFIENMNIYEEHFIENFNRANNLLIYLYNHKYKNNVEKDRLLELKKAITFKNNY